MKNKLKKLINTFPLFFISFSNYALAADLNTKEITEATNNIQRVITSIAIPLGSVIIFASIVITAIRMIVNSNNPGKRTESIGSLAWITAGGVLLGLSLVLAGVILNIATNGTGKLI